MSRITPEEAEALTAAYYPIRMWLWRRLGWRWLVRGLVVGDES